MPRQAGSCLSSQALGRIGEIIVSMYRRMPALSLLPFLLASCVSTPLTGVVDTHLHGARQPVTAQTPFVAPAEFEPQEYIWLTWVDQGWLGGAPFTDVTLDVMRAITPHVRVRLMYSAFTSEDASMFREPFLRSPAEAEGILRKRLQTEGVDLSRVDLFYYPRPVGAIQDPGPYFLRSIDGRLALADYGFEHPDPRIEAIDREIAARLGLPTVRSPIASEGGARQVNGRGTLLLVESVELARNPGKSRDEIEHEHRRVHGATNVIWLKHGPADEEWGKLRDGRWGIGTGGHVDVFARFADERTILLAQVGERLVGIADGRRANPVTEPVWFHDQDSVRFVEAEHAHSAERFALAGINQTPQVRLPVFRPTKLRGIAKAERLAGEAIESERASGAQVGIHAAEQFDKECRVLFELRR